MSSLVLAGDTSGSITVSAPAVAGTQTLTLPAASGTVMVSGNMPAFSAYGANVQSIPTNSLVKLQFNTKQFDTNTNYDATTNYRFTPTVAGYYQVNACVALNMVTGNGVCYIFKNGSPYFTGTYAAGTANIGNYISVSVSSLVYCNGTTDYLESYVYQSNGSNVNTGNSSSNFNFNGSLVRGA